MADTTNLTLPLVAASQAQKHITVNEALVRLDGLTQLRLISRTLQNPPVANDGECYGVPAGGTNAWIGHDGEVAVFSNGGWVFATPLVGWRAYIVDEGCPALFNGVAWEVGAVATSASGATSKFEVIETTHQMGSGPTSTTAQILPANSIVFGVTGRVSDEITGSAASFELGVSGSSNRYGSGYGLALGSFVHGLTSAPISYYADTELELTATSGSFNGGGQIILSAHVFRMTAPF